MLQTDSHIPQSRVITKTRNKFFEIVAVAERYLAINSCKNKESKKQLLRIYLLVKLGYGRMSMKKAKNSSDLIYVFQLIVSLNRMDGKAFNYLLKYVNILV